jgi:hypothetical protein
VAPVIAYQRAFEFAVSSAELWAAIEDVEAYERRWPWLRDFGLESGSLVPEASPDVLFDESWILVEQLDIPSA